MNNPKKHKEQNNRKIYVHYKDESKDKQNIQKLSKNYNQVICETNTQKEIYDLIVLKESD